ncbi:TPA: hypothetical protein IAA68_00920 [Candidatus Galligastranaerophilus faecipullorum]|nr:hypothetical protein [Candidatus Galligastranaerophilus faecipullorum]
MKKIILALSVVLFAQSAYAYLEEGKTADVARMQNSGYSQAALKLIDRTASQQQGDGTLDGEHYVRYYKDYKPKNGLAAFYTKAKIYIDPVTDDDFFGRHEHDFNNAWFPDLHDSTVRVNPNRASGSTIEDL